MIKNKKVIILLAVILIVLLSSALRFVATNYRKSISESQNLKDTNSSINSGLISFYNFANPPYIGLKKVSSLATEYDSYRGISGQVLNIEAKDYHDFQERLMFEVRKVSPAMTGFLMGAKNNNNLLSVTYGWEDPEVYGRIPSNIAPHNVTSAVYLVNISKIAVDVRPSVLDKVEKITSSVILDDDRIIFIQDHNIIAYKLGDNKFSEVKYASEIPKNEVYQFSDGMMPDDPSFNGKTFKIRKCTLPEKTVCTLQSFEFPN